MVSTPKPVVQAAPEPLPPPPARSDTETQALAEEQRKRFTPGGNNASNFLTRSGVTSATSAVQFLGGASKT